MTTTTNLSRASTPESAARPETGPAGTGWARSAAIAGVTFVVLNVAGTFAPGAPPASDASATKIAAYFRDHGGAIKAQLLLGGLGIAALMWWFGELWHMMSRSDGSRPTLPIVAAISLASGLVLAMMNGVFNAAAAIRVDNLDTTRLLYSLSFVAVAAAGFGLAVFLTTASVATSRNRLVPRWTSYLGALAALAFLGSTLGTISSSNAVNSIGLVAFLIWCAWILAMSAYMWRGASAAA